MSVLIKPIITEKATIDSEKNNRYTFSVAPEANKLQIKKAVEDAYAVKVTDVKTNRVAVKRTVKYTKKGLQMAKTNIIKKAVVSLEEGQTIDLYSNN